VALKTKKIDMIIIFACLVGWLNSSPVEIQKKIEIGLLLAGVNTGMALM